LVTERNLRGAAELWSARDLSPLWIAAEPRWSSCWRRLVDDGRRSSSGPAALRAKPKRWQVARTPHAGAVRQALRTRCRILRPQT